MEPRKKKVIWNLTPSSLNLRTTDIYNREGRARIVILTSSGRQLELIRYMYLSLDSGLYGTRRIHESLATFLLEQSTILQLLGGYIRGREHREQLRSRMIAGDVQIWLIRHLDCSDEVE